MEEFRISVDLSIVLDGVNEVVNEQVLPLLAQAVRGVAQQAAGNWKESVHHAKLWSGERDAYADSIQWKETGPFSALVWSDYKYADEIESGRPARDLKKYLDTSQKVRRNHDGKRYLIIPFRHNVPGSGDEGGSQMPKDVYDIAKDLKPSAIIGTTKRISGLTATDVKTKRPLMVQQNIYSWGDKFPAGMRELRRAHHKTDVYAGMYRFHAETPGGKRYSTYITFRVMSEGARGWVIPPQPGQHLVQQVVGGLKPLAEKAFNEAIKRTLG